MAYLLQFIKPHIAGPENVFCILPYRQRHWIDAVKGSWTLWIFSTF